MSAATPSENQSVDLAQEARRHSEALSGKTVAILGYGNQGRAQALNLRDSGVRVIAGCRTDGRARAMAIADRIDVLELHEACHASDLVVIALPDEVHETVWKSSIEKALRPGTTVGFLHGFSVRFGHVRPAASHGVVMVAPKGPGHTLRLRYTEGLGLPALVAVHQHGPDAAETRARMLAWAAGIGSARAAVVQTTFAIEAETDLFGEQAVLCGGAMALVQAAFETLVKAGYPADIAYMECCQELKQLADLVYERGLAGMRQAISNTAEFGAFEAQSIDTPALRDDMRRMLAQIRDGAFAERFRADARAGFPWMNAQRAKADSDAIERAGRAVRDWLPWLQRAEKPR